MTISLDGGVFRKLFYCFWSETYHVGIVFSDGLLVNYVGEVRVVFVVQYNTAFFIGAIMIDQWQISLLDVELPFLLHDHFY